jgi:hypothetical protein
MAKFIHNKSTYKVSLIDSKILLNQGEKKQIEDKDADHPDVTHAIRAGWVYVEGPVSKTKAADPTPAITFQVDPLKGSDTIPVIKPNVDATSSAIGSTSEPEVTEEEVVASSKKNKKAANAAAAA